jgi:hypothetical protein
MISKIEIERSPIASKQFDDLVAAINAGIGHPDMVWEKLCGMFLESVFVIPPRMHVTTTR